MKIDHGHCTYKGCGDKHHKASKYFCKKHCMSVDHVHCTKEGCEEDLSKGSKYFCPTHLQNNDFLLN